MFHQIIPHTREGAILAVLQRATPWLRVDGILSLENAHLSVLCINTRHQIIVGFDTLSSWHTYRQIVGAATPEREVAS